MRKVATPHYFAEQATATIPPTGFVAIYAKADGFLYGRDDAGTETQLGRLFVNDSSFATATTTNVSSSTAIKAYVDNSITALDELADGDGTTVSSSGGFSRTNLQATIPADKTADYTLAVGDEGDLISFNSASLVTLTFPQNSSQAIGVGKWGFAFQEGAGGINTVAGSGATLIGSGAGQPTLTAGALIKWFKIGTNAFLVEVLQSFNGPAVDRQTFSASGTWTKPAAVSATSMTLIKVVGGGGGGGGGRVAAAGTAHGGGGGGGGGGYSEIFIPTELLGSTETVTIGVGGTGGAGGVQPTNDGTNGTANSTSTTFGGWVSGGLGAAGAGGTTAGGAGGASGATTQGSVPIAASSLNGANIGGSFGGNGGVGAGYPVRPGGFNAFGIPTGNLNPGGGGGGGGITSGGAVETGSNGGHGTVGTKAGGAGGSAGTAGGVGTDGTVGGGGGGGGSGSRVGATGAAGGAGGAVGGGGGGGGATSGAFNAGAGGNGGAGWCVVITWL